MRRREFISLFSGAAAAWPVMLQAQAPVARIGFLGNLAPDVIPTLLGAFREGLQERGYSEGRNFVIEYRWGAPPDQKLAAELVARDVNVIVSWGTPATAAARAATQKIPIVMVGVADPIGAGLVASLSRPGGNVTGTTNLSRDLGGKLLEVLLEIVPLINPVFVLRNPQNPASALQLREIEVAARTFGIGVELVEAANSDQLEPAFAQMVRANAKGVILLAEPLFIGNGPRIADLAQRARLPSVFSRRENVEAGGLLSYGPSLRGQFRDTAVYVDKILKGANPADLPVEQPARLEFILNLKTAKAIGLTVPPILLVRADEVIE